MQLPAAPPLVIAPAAGFDKLTTGEVTAPASPHVSAATQPEATKPLVAEPVDRIEFMVSDIRAELRSINRKFGCLIVLFVLALAAGIAAAVILINQAGRLTLG